MPVLRSPLELVEADLRQTWRALWPRSQPLTNVEASKGALTFDADGASAAAMVMPAPIPNNELAGPAATSWLWPTATQDLAGYGAHIVVWASRAASHLAAFQTMTRVAATIVRATNALGVYMGGAGLVIKGDLFVEMAQELELPVALWVDLRCMREPDGRSSLFTVGLNQLGLHEIEIPAANKACGDLRIWTMNLGAWLIESRPTINQGETVGLSQDERIRVDYADSMVGRLGPVMRLTGL